MVRPPIPYPIWFQIDVSLALSGIWRVHLFVFPTPLVPNYFLLGHLPDHHETKDESESALDSSKSPSRGYWWLINANRKGAKQGTKPIWTRLAGQIRSDILCRQHSIFVSKRRKGTLGAALWSIRSGRRWRRRCWRSRGKRGWVNQIPWRINTTFGSIIIIAILLVH